MCHPKFETEAARLGGELERNDQHIDVEENLPILTIDEVCWIDRQRRMDSEHCHRREVLSGFTTRQDRLFPGLTQHTSGRYSDALSKKFARHLRDTGLKDAGLSFHSLRHTFTHKFKVAAPRDAETRERLLGHAVAGVAGRYGKSFAAEAADMQLLEERARTLALIEF